MRHAISRLCVASLACLAASGIQAQTALPAAEPGARACAPLPAIKPGAWVVLDRSGVKLRSTVTEVTDTRISARRESLSGVNMDNGNDSYTREWGLFSGTSNSNTNVSVAFSPHYSTLKFPLCTGDSHEQKVTWQAQGYSANGILTLKTRVAAKETLSIAGKEFEVFRVEFDSGSQGGTVWYSPELARTIKLVSKTATWVVVEYGGY